MIYINIISKIITPSILLIITICTGFVISYLGKPYQVAIFTIHKLIALIAVVMFILFFKDYFLLLKTQNLIIIFLIICLLSVITLFVTGALLSIGKMPYASLKIIHSLSPIIMIISLGISVYLLSK